MVHKVRPEHFTKKFLDQFGAVVRCGKTSDKVKGISKVWRGVDCKACQRFNPRRKK